MDILGTLGKIGAAGISAAYNKNAADVQYRRQRELMAIQMQNQQRLNEQGNQLQMDMWKKTNYGAQVGMLKEAGLNPALLYAKGGSGGTTGGQTGGSAGMNSASMAMPMDVSGITELANLKLIEAQTQNINADTNAKNGWQRDKGLAEIGNIQEATKLITQQIGTEEAKKIGLELDNVLKGIDNYIAENTKDVKVEIVKQDLERAKKLNEQLQIQIESSGMELEKKEEMLQQLIDQGNLNIALTGIKIAAEKAGIKLTNTTINKINTELLQGWKKLNIETYDSVTKRQAVGVSKEGIAAQKEMNKQMTETMVQVAGMNGLFGLNKELMEWAGDYLPNPATGKRGHRYPPAPKNYYPKK